MQKVKNKKGLVLVLMLIVLILSACSSTTPTDSNTPSSNSEVQATPEAAIEVDTKAFVTEFDENQLAAEAKYKGKIVKFTGYVDNISEDIVGEAFVKIDPNNDQYYYGTSIQCYFKSKDALLNLKNGQQVTLQGRFDSQIMNILVKDCQVM